jgi:hypothetical protein
MVTLRMLVQRRRTCVYRSSATGIAAVAKICEGIGLELAAPDEITLISRARPLRHNRRLLINLANPALAERAE